MSALFRAPWGNSRSPRSPPSSVTAASQPSRTNAPRWTTFDCYGTLIDWNLGIRRELERLFGVEAAPHLLARYHELEPEIESEPFRTYREVLALALERLAQEEGIQLPEGEAGALGRSLPDWPPFPEVPRALAELRERGWRLAILSNTDRDLIAASQQQLGVPVDLAIVAEDVESYKPAHGHWERFFEKTTADRERHVHVAASLFHDIAPARELGLRSVWINRLDEQANPEPDRELPDLSALPETLEDLVPA
jgi:2-haloacid dehalogenase